MIEKMRKKNKYFFIFTELFVVYIYIYNIVILYRAIFNNDYTFYCWLIKNYLELEKCFTFQFIYDHIIKYFL